MVLNDPAACGPQDFPIPHLNCLQTRRASAHACSSICLEHFSPCSHYLHGILHHFFQISAQMMSPMLGAGIFPLQSPSAPSSLSQWSAFYRTFVTAWHIYVSACLCVCSEDWIQVLVRKALTELSPQLPFVLFCLFTVCLFTLNKKRFFFFFCSEQCLAYSKSSRSICWRNKLFLA